MVNELGKTADPGSGYVGLRLTAPTTKDEGFFGTTPSYAALVSTADGSGNYDVVGMITVSTTWHQTGSGKMGIEFTSRGNTTPATTAVHEFWYQITRIG